MRRGILAAATVFGLLVVGGPTPSGATASTSAEGFDTCQAMPTSGMRSLGTGTYKVANIYIGGVNRGCTQPNLSARWVTTIAAAGWTLIPTYVGLQAPCSNDSSLMRMTNPSADGIADADDAVTQMDSLGLAGPNIVYDDMEAYGTTCSAAVGGYLDAFIAELHKFNFRAGVYGSTGSTVADLVNAYGNTARQRPDDIWIAEPNGVDGTSSAAVPSADWVGHRIRQWEFNDSVAPLTGDPSSAPVDRDAVGGDVAVPTAAPLAPYFVEGTPTGTPLHERTSPSTSASSPSTDAEGTQLTIACQTTGDSVFGDNVWDQLQDGNYVSDLYVSTPGGLGYAGTIPLCSGNTARITTPYSNANVQAGSRPTVFVDIPEAATFFEVQRSLDGGSTWTTAGMADTAGNDDPGVSIGVPATIGTTMLLRAIVSDGGTSWNAVNQVTLHVVGPTATIAALPSGTTASVVTLHWSGADGSSRPSAYDIRYERAAWSGTFGNWVVPSGWTGTTATSKALALAEGYDYCVEVRAHGVLGETGLWSAPRCIARVLDDRSLAASTGWTRGTASGYYDRTYTSTRTVSKVLTRTGAVADRIGILATTCATCGKVALYIANHYVGTVSLVTNRTHLQQLLTVPVFGLRTGTVVIRTLTSGPLVQIDGVLITRT